MVRITANIEYRQEIIGPFDVLSELCQKRSGTVNEERSGAINEGFKQAVQQILHQFNTNNKGSRNYQKVVSDEHCFDKREQNGAKLR